MPTKQGWPSQRSPESWWKGDLVTKHHTVTSLSLPLHLPEAFMQGFPAYELQMKTSLAGMNKQVRMWVETSPQATSGHCVACDRSYHT